MLSVIAASLVFLSVTQFLSLRRQDESHDVTIAGIRRHIREPLPVSVPDSITVSSIEDPVTVSEIQNEVTIDAPLRVTIER